MREKKVVIVGAGVAGMVAGIELARAGVRCEILEREPRAGGNLGGWRREGIEIDNCIHWLCGTREGGALFRLWESCGALGGSVRILRRRALYTSFAEREGARVCFDRDPERTAEQMRAIAPEDKAEIDRFLSAVLAVRRVARGGFFPGKTLWEGAALLPYARRSLGAVAARFQNKLLRASMTDFLPGVYNAAGFLLTYGNFTAGNADVPADGSAAMAARMAARFCSLGGVLRLGARAEEVLLRGGRAVGVRLCGRGGEEGETISADRVILACDPTAIFGKLLPQDTMPRSLADLYMRERVYPVWSALQFSFATRGARLPFSGTVAFPIRPFTLHGSDHTRLTVRAPQICPANADERSARAGVIECLLPIDARAARQWIAYRKASFSLYAERKSEMAAEILARIEDFFPSLRGQLFLLDARTPATYRRYLGAEYGAFMSFALTERDLLHTAKVLLTQDTDRTAVPRGLTDVRLAGQWMHLPGGLPSAAVSGKRAAAWAIRKEK